MRIGVFVINLDRSVERWTRLSRQAQGLDIALTRIEGVNGRAIAPGSWEDVDPRRFVRHNGRTMLPGEYGCYRSHIRALETFLNSGNDVAVILEDDVDLPKDLLPRTEAIFRAAPDADVVKLLNHRSLGFRSRVTTALGDEVGRCIHGPQGSAACYAVTRHGAELILSGMREMDDPYDVALERGWRYAAQVMSVRSNIAELVETDESTAIGTREDYRRTKLRGLRKLRTHLHRAVEYARRIRYALW